MKKCLSKDLIIYQTKTGAFRLRKDSDATVWASQTNIAEIFEVDRSVVAKHIRNILKSEELDADSVCAKFAHTADDGKTYQVQFYNLDVILAVGYRVNSVKAITFRQWATKTLKDHITKGYTVNPERIRKNYQDFLHAVEKVRALLPEDKKTIDTENIFELITLFADTWFSLDAYDKDKLAATGSTKKKIKLTAEKLNTALVELKTTLIAKGEATEIFGKERTKNSVENIIGNVMQLFDDKELYPTIEEKAAHLLYFIIKNHPFVDGNKRSGAYAFIWFLNRARALDTSRITPPALTAITLLIAESNPKDKDKMVGLVCALLRKNN